MTLSNFDWTDKETVRWFVLLPTGHEGPYSLATLQNKKLSKEVKIWSEGLEGPLKFSEALANAVQVPVVIEELPPLPVEEEVEIPDLPPETPPVEIQKTKIDLSKFKLWGGGVALLGLFLYLLINQFIKSGAGFSITRLPKMSQVLKERIEKDIGFEGWDKKLFFKEYVPSDLSHIWLVTAGFQTCDVEASFRSLKDKLLTLKEESVAFKTQGRLTRHIVEFSRFDFSQGAKIIPGLYEVEITAKNCSWDGLRPRLANGFSSPEEDYFGRMKVVLYPAGAIEFNALLDKLLKKKIDAEKKVLGEEQMFWEDLQQKYQTLLAITLQIEQFFVDVLERDEKTFTSKLKKSVDLYTTKFGHFLTQFVVSNEEYFKELEKKQPQQISQKRTYAPQIRVTAKEIGHESMKLIEDLQKTKTPTKVLLNAKKAKALKTFERLKDGINKRIIQVTEDRSL